MNRDFKKSDDRGEAFSLIEVVFSLGIISVALLSVLALLGQAINGAHDAAGRTIGSQISQRLMGEVQLMDWASLTEPTDFRYFDEFGNELDDAKAAKDDSIFTAYADILDTPLSFSSDPGAENTHSRKVIIIVADSPGDRGQQMIETYRADGEISPDLYLFSSTLVNLDK